MENTKEAIYQGYFSTNMGSFKESVLACMEQYKNIHISESEATIESLLSRVAGLEGAMNTVIEYNMQEAADKYGDRNKANTWACVETLRNALTPQP